MAESFTFGNLVIPMLNSSTQVCISCGSSAFSLNKASSPKIIKTWSFSKTITGVFAMIYYGGSEISYSITDTGDLYFHAGIAGTTMTETTSGVIQISTQGALALLYSGTTLNWTAYSSISGSQGFSASCMIAWVSLGD